MDMAGTVKRIQEECEMDLSHIENGREDVHKALVIGWTETMKDADVLSQWNARLRPDKTTYSVEDIECINKLHSDILRFEDQQSD